MLGASAAEEIVFESRLLDELLGAVNGIAFSDGAETQPSSRGFLPNFPGAFIPLESGGGAFTLGQRVEASLTELGNFEGAREQLHPRISKADFRFRLAVIQLINRACRTKFSQLVFELGHQPMGVH